MKTLVFTSKIYNGRAFHCRPLNTKYPKLNFLSRGKPLTVGLLG